MRGSEAIEGGCTLLRQAGEEVEKRGAQGGRAGGCAPRSLPDGARGQTNLPSPRSLGQILGVARVDKPSGAVQWARRPSRGHQTHPPNGLLTEPRPAKVAARPAQPDAGVGLSLSGGAFLPEGLGGGGPSTNDVVW